MKVPATAAGKKSKCPKCGDPVVVPNETTLPAVIEKPKLPAKPKSVEVEVRQEKTVSTSAIVGDFFAKAKTAASHVAEIVTRDNKPPVNADPATPPLPEISATVVPPLPVTSSTAVSTPCRYCGEEILSTALKCKHCGEFLDGRPREPVAPQVVIHHAPPVQAAPAPNIVIHNNNQNVATAIAGGYMGRRWSRLVAGLLSICPGLGQAYKGQIINGAVWFALVICGYALFFFPGAVLHVCCILGAMSGPNPMPR
jgi:predicted RNA-binding Zn-ribbon protein involved in translation (DUF1610 family)